MPESLAIVYLICQVTRNDDVVNFLAVLYKQPIVVLEIVTGRLLATDGILDCISTPGIGLRDANSRYVLRHQLDDNEPVNNRGLANRLLGSRGVLTA